MPTDGRVLHTDTETTGLSCADGDKLVEIGIVEMIDRKPTGRVFHRYIDPGFEIPEEATKVHGLTREDVISLGEGRRFADIAQEMLDFIDGDQLVIHNAPFDMGFLDKELTDARFKKLSEQCSVFDTLRFAGVKFPGSRNNLDALCKRYGIDTSERTEHGALLDARLLCEVYVALTRHQVKLDLDGRQVASSHQDEGFLSGIERIDANDLLIIAATPGELSVHEAHLKKIASKRGGASVWEPEEIKEIESKAKINRAPAVSCPY